MGAEQQEVEAGGAVGRWRGVPRPGAAPRGRAAAASPHTAPRRAPGSRTRPAPGQDERELLRRGGAGEREEGGRAARRRRGARAAPPPRWPQPPRRGPAPRGAGAAPRRPPRRLRSYESDRGRPCPRKSTPRLHPPSPRSRRRRPGCEAAQRHLLLRAFFITSCPGWRAGRRRAAAGRRRRRGLHRPTPGPPGTGPTTAALANRVLLVAEQICPVTAPQQQRAPSSGAEAVQQPA